MSTDVPEAIPAPKGRSSRIAMVITLLLATAALAIGLTMTLKAGVELVDTIRVSKHSMIPESFVGTPDYYLTIAARDGKTIETKVFSDTPIGNGLDFKLVKPLELQNIAHVELMDEDVASDDIRDRVEVRGRVSRGQNYEFELFGPPPPRRTAGYVALACSAVLLLVAVILLVRSHAV